MPLLVALALAALLLVRWLARRLEADPVAEQAT
jgi:hypothetical protein